ncbi:hypothetical protein [Polyangium fumosum]|uniref:Uncharacterized protein n=1 Tax=Polyangium fumosum TaxID=889272 RepID=A0A4U1IUD1_9BACT|nr:hypothetical protein [Polyangium fumosum]TKC98023.1 hypothetical protein E8A74_42935 [Polyangium fumosum]
MSAQIPSGPFFVPPYVPEHGGVDFLGLRQANLEMMATCLPGINNVTVHVRPFSLLSWIHWKFHELAAAAGQKQIFGERFSEFRERVEVLFTWGHVRNGIGGIPGTTAKPPMTDDGAAVPLTFAAWKRSYENTSLMAAVQYGPASKTVGGLGFLDPVGGGFHRACGEGVRLAEAIDETLASCASTHLLGLEPGKGTEEDATNLFPGWSVLTPTMAEQASFRKAFFDEGAVGEESEMGWRSATLALAFAVLTWAERPLSLDEIRRAMVYARLPDHAPLVVPERLHTARLRWTALQVRQTQRLAHECLLVWLERRIARGDRDSEMMVRVAMLAIEEILGEDAANFTVGDLAERLVPEMDSFEALCERAIVEEDACVFAAVSRIDDALRSESEDDTLVAHALRALLLCARAAELLAVEPVAERAMGTGHVERVSLKHWRGTVARCRSRPAREFLTLLFESMVLSQHFAVAANRYDGGTQRLRVSIEEEGLTVLAPKPWRVQLTSDRLASAMALAADCGLIKVGEEDGTFEAA